MSRSTTSFFPDINVWIALTSARHLHFQIAHDWFDAAPEEAKFFFCRYTQIGFLRLLTMEAVMRRDVMDRPRAWKTYDRWLADSRIAFAEEPAGVETFFRTMARSRHPATTSWPDAYLLAFATAAQFTLVTFDRALRTKSTSVVLLGE